MKRYPCRSRLYVTCQESTPGGDKIVTIQLDHHAKHVHYVDVTMPPGAVDIIRENVEWLTPVTMVGKVQAVYPSVTSAQIHTAWIQMSQLFWRRDNLQLPSARKLLDEYGDEVDVFSPRNVPEGVDILCWGMKKIETPLHGKIIEVALDATCKPYLTFQISMLTNESR